MERIPRRSQARFESGTGLRFRAQARARGLARTWWRLLACHPHDIHAQQTRSRYVSTYSGGHMTAREITALRDIVARERLALAYGPNWYRRIEHAAAELDNSLEAKVNRIVAA